MFGRPEAVPGTAWLATYVQAWTHDPVPGTVPLDPEARDELDPAA
jgi:hypothetical protein